MELVEERPIRSITQGSGTIKAMLLVHIEITDGKPEKIILGREIEYCLTEVCEGYGAFACRPVSEEVAMPNWPYPEPAPRI